MKANADAPPKWIGPALVAVVGGGAIFYFWLLFTRWAHAEQWGNFGDAVGPFVALLNAGALFAALNSVRLQRQELALQRQELAATREVMREQAAQAKETADAQKRLAESQERLAKGQGEANRMAWFAEIAQKRSTLATLHAAISRLDLAAAEQGTRGGPFRDPIVKETKRSRDFLQLLAAEENQRIRFVEKNLAINYKVTPEDAWVGHINPREITEDDESKA